MKNIRNFDLKSAYENYVKSSEYTYHNVSFAKDANKIFYDNKHDFRRPESTDNTQAQDDLAESIVERAKAATATVKIDFSEEGVLNNIEFPDDVQKFVYLTGSCENGLTLKSEAQSSIALTVTNDEPIDIIVDSNKTVYLHGKFRNIWTNAPISLSSTDEIYGTVTFDDDYDGTVTITAIMKNGSKVQTLTTGNVTVNNGGEETSFEVYAPNADVFVGGRSSNIVTITAKSDTIYLKQNCYINKLKVINGKVKVYGLDVNEFVGTLISDDTIEPMEFNVPTDVSVAKMTSTPGIYKFVEDVETSSVIGFGIVASGKFKYDLNGKNVTLGNKNYALFLRGTVEVNICGDGKFENGTTGYCAWVSSTGATLNIYGGELIGNTHTVYAEKGTVNIYGGTFKMSNADTADRDVNGNLKFLLNCYDASYTGGDARITVYGGKFYEFNPAESYSEPGGPVNFVADGYHVVESEEEGKRVFTVVKD